MLVWVDLHRVEVGLCGCQARADTCEGCSAYRVGLHGTKTMCAHCMSTRWGAHFDRRCGAGCCALHAFFYSMRRALTRVEASEAAGASTVSTMRKMSNVSSLNLTCSLHAPPGKMGSSEGTTVGVAIGYEQGEEVCTGY